MKLRSILTEIENRSICIKRINYILKEGKDWNTKVIDIEKNPDKWYEKRTEIVDGEQFGCDDYQVEFYYSLKDGSLIGDKKMADMLSDYGIIPERKRKDLDVASIGFSPKDNKWYGWSHRAIYGFEPGSKVKKGDSGYVSDNVDELYDEQMEWFSGNKENVYKLPTGLQIKHEMVKYTTEDPDTGELGGCVPDKPDYQFIEIGRGEWTAKTMEDAKQMAIDFADSVA